MKLDSSTMDVDFVTNQGSVPAHKCFLATISIVFKVNYSSNFEAICYGGFIESNDNPLRIKTNISKYCLQQIINYWYGSQFCKNKLHYYQLFQSLIITTLRKHTTLHSFSRFKIELISGC